VLVSDLAAKAGEDGVSWVAADRALAAAKDSGDPATIAAASRAVAIAMRRMGHYDTATRLLTGTALSLGADRGNPPAPVLAAYGHHVPLPGRLPPGSPAHSQGGQGKRAEEHDDPDDQQEQQALGDHADDAQGDRHDH
jgi:hypothetical protein